MLPLTCLAQWRSLECIDKSQFSLYLQINEQLKQVKTGDLKATNVNFDKDFVIFTVILSNGPDKWIHILSRSTGNLTVQNATSKIFISPYKGKLINNDSRLF
jgi:hypothetical protein